jgi:hypothetical protein
MTARDVIKAHIGGPLILTKYVKDMDKYTVVEAKKFQEIAFNQFMAYMYLDNADKAKYGTLLTGLNTQTSYHRNVRSINEWRKIIYQPKSNGSK